MLLLLGLAVGSFLNVVALRYRPDKFLFDYRVWRGRSTCPHCGATLRWYELVPVVSYLWQVGRCRSCKAKISPQYPIVELLTGLIFAFTPAAVARLVVSELAPLRHAALAALWIGILCILLVVTVVDLRHFIVPDEATIAIALLGGGVIAVTLGNQVALLGRSFVGHYALLLGMQQSIIINRLAALAAALLFFAIPFAVTRGRGMGFGDVKLAAALALPLGWPDALLAFALAFMVGTLWFTPRLVWQKLSFKARIPFAPFIAAATALVVFFGVPLIDSYFKLVAAAAKVF